MPGDRALADELIGQQVAGDLKTGGGCGGERLRPP
jgi:hypothetical protein